MKKVKELGAAEIRLELTKGTVLMKRDNDDVMMEFQNVNKGTWVLIFDTITTILNNQAEEVKDKRFK